MPQLSWPAEQNLDRIFTATNANPRGLGQTTYDVLFDGDGWQIPDGAGTFNANFEDYYCTVSFAPGAPAARRPRRRPPPPLFGVEARANLHRTRPGEVTADVKLENAGVTAASHVQIERTRLLLLGNGWSGMSLATFRPVQVLPTRRRRLGRGHDRLEKLVFHVRHAAPQGAPRVARVVRGGSAAPHGNGQWQRHPSDYREEFAHFTPPFQPPMAQA